MEKKITNTEGKEENFHEIFKKRLELNRIARELGLDVDNLKEAKSSPEGEIFDEFYGKDFEEINQRASTFKISDFGEENSHLRESVKALKKQKKSYEAELEVSVRKILENQAQIDYEEIFTKLNT